MRLLLLGGTQEAYHIAQALLREDGLNIVVSLARPERQPRPFGWPVRIGGFGGENPFKEWLSSGGFDAVLDAGHPFAVRMSHRVARSAKAENVEYVRFLRPAWSPSECDTWTFLNAPKDAVSHIEDGSTVFLGTGRRDLNEFSGIKNSQIICRVRDREHDPFPWPNGRFLLGSGPFTVRSEMMMLRRNNVDWLVTRNSGGVGSWPKVEAARELGIRVAMIRRPLQPEALRIDTVAEALAWVRRRL